MRIFAAALLAVPLLAHAVGLGNLRVLSALGQPLNAEIQIVSEQPGEMNSVTARLPSQDAFRQAGIEFNPVLLGMKFEVEQRDGKSVLKLTTTQPVNEPFLDILVELQWSSGRLVREYTFLLDPPEYKATQAISPAPSAAPTETPAQVPAAQAPVQEQPLEPAPAPAPAVTPAPAPAPAATAAPKPPAAPEAKSPATREVKKGDTLGAIARENLARGITYNQMLIALYRANRDAFIRDNINLVRAGRILDLPDQETVAAIDPEDARRLVRSQMADFAAYRRKLAAAAPATSAGAGERAVSGQISSTPEQAAPAAQKDQLKLSKADAGSGPISRAAREDDQAARERALQEAQSRVAELERNVSDLQKLVELKDKALDVKSKELADLQHKAAAAPAAPMPAPAVPAARSPAAAPPGGAEAPKPVAPPAKPAAEAAPKPTPKPALKPKASPPPPPSLLDDLLDNPAAVGGLGAVLVLLLGYGAWTWRRKKKAAALQGGTFDAAAGAGGASSVLSAAGMPSVRADAGSQASVSQASVGGMEADEVDPIAEADVYMAYGRDAQAEEILKEALQKVAKRPAIHAKLLEIYAARHDATSFEQTARNLQALTGSGPEWEKAAALGRSIDPQNSLYGGAGEAAVTRTGTPAQEAAVAAAPVPNLDFDLDAASTPISPDIPLDIGEDEGKQQPSSGLDFDIGSSTNTMKAGDFAKGGTLIMDRNAEPKTEPAGLDFDLGLGGGDAQKTADSGGISFESPTTPEQATADTLGSMDFNLDLDTADTKPMPAPAAEPAPLDLSSISLDLGAPGEGSASTTSTDPKWQEVATKLDLAKAYEEMGDKDGARELLNEVVKEGDNAQQSQAKQMLSSLG
jgi:pilus assembly protein FimV